MYLDMVETMMLKVRRRIELCTADAGFRRRVSQPRELPALERIDTTAV